MSPTLISRCSFQFLSHHEMARCSRSLRTRNCTKVPYQGGRNLGDRYWILENSLRGKEALKRCQNNQRQLLVTEATDTLSPQSTNQGFVVPVEPPPPESDGITSHAWWICLSLTCSCYSMLHVWLCHLCLWSLWRISRSLQESHSRSSDKAVFNEYTRRPMAEQYPISQKIGSKHPNS